MLENIGVQKRDLISSKRGIHWWY